jgi:hypothetical protein
MWQDGDDFNEHGEPVKLYQPSQGPPRRTDKARRDSHIGGHVTEEEVQPCCTKCKEDMFLLVQLHMPDFVKVDGSAVDRTVFVFGCPRTDCSASLTFENGFVSGGDGVMVCRRMETPVAAQTSKSTTTIPEAPIKSAWYSEDSKDDNDWDMSEGVGNIDLESAMSAMEEKAEKQGGNPKPKATTKSVPTSSTTK